MKVIKQSYNILDIPDAIDTMEVLKYLERIGRTCYKSEDLITDESCIKFINMLKSRQHWAMLEHYIFVLSIPKWIYEGIVNSKHSHYDLIFKYDYIKLSETGLYDNPYIMSFSATTLNYILKAYEENPISNKAMNTIGCFMANKFPELIFNSEIYDDDTYKSNDISLLTMGEINNLPMPLQLIHNWISVKFITHIGISHEIVRHRPASYAQESTRYCTYTKNKFGNELTFIEPIFINDKERYKIWEKQMKSAESAYRELITAGSTAQEAAAVLPKSTKTEIVMTARLIEWNHFFKMRADGAAHPQMQELAFPLFHECKERFFNIIKK